MSKSCKTIDVAEIAASLQLALSLDKTIDGKRALCFAVEKVLMDSGNYHGFQWADSEYARSSALDHDDVRHWDRRYYGVSKVSVVWA